MEYTADNAVGCVDKANQKYKCEVKRKLNPCWGRVIFLRPFLYPFPGVVNMGWTCEGGGGDCERQGKRWGQQYHRAGGSARSATPFFHSRQTYDFDMWT